MSLEQLLKKKPSHPNFEGLRGAFDGSELERLLLEILRPPTETLIGEKPAAGAEISYKIPGGRRLFLASVSFTFTASSAAAERSPRLEFTDGSNRIFATGFLIFSTQAGFAANSSHVLSAAEQLGLTQDTRGFAAVASLPKDFELSEGWLMQTVTDNIQTGDQYSAPVLYVRSLRFSRGR